MGNRQNIVVHSFLFVSGKTDRLGRVDEGSSSMDYEPEEQKRHVSISSANNFFDWNRCKINIIDTPGDSNFSFDTQSCLRIVDGCVVVIDAVGGVEFQTQKVWEYADEYKLPRIIFINRMDRNGRFLQVLESITEKMKRKVTPICLPLGKEDVFRVSLTLWP